MLMTCEGKAGMMGRRGKGDGVEAQGKVERGGSGEGEGEGPSEGEGEDLPGTTWTACARLGLGLG